MGGPLRQEEPENENLNREHDGDGSKNGARGIMYSRRRLCVVEKRYVAITSHPRVELHVSSCPSIIGTNKPLVCIVEQRERERERERERGGGGVGGRGGG